MTSFNSLSIKWKLNLIVFSVAAITLLLAVFVNNLNHYRNFKHRMVQEITNLSRIIAFNTASAVAFSDKDTAKQILDSLTSDRQIILSCVYDKSGRFFAGYRSTGKNKPFPPLEIYKHSICFEKNNLTLLQDIVLNDEIIGTVVIKHNLESLHKHHQDTVLFTAGILSISFCIIAFLSYYFQQTISGPIIKLTNKIKTISHERTGSTKHGEDTTDELSVLIKEFDHMAIEIRNRDRYLEQQVAIRTSELKAANVELSDEIIIRKRIDKEMKLSINEKNTLLKEIHHRVKNNLAIVSSLLDLQSAGIDDPKFLNLFSECQNRIYSIALVHNMLYQSRNISDINFGEYINKLTDSLISTYLPSASPIDVETNVKDVKFNIDRSIYCGLIINELFTNAVKHAFPNGRKGKITIDISTEKDSLYCLRCSDDGIGLSDKIDTDHMETLGLKLIAVLVEQLKGKLKISRGNGTSFAIYFRV